MKPTFRHPLIAFGLLALACAGWARWSAGWPSGVVRAHRAPLRYACWYWHRPFRLTPADARSLRSAHIDRLYVYAGTLVAQRREVRLIRTQQWETEAPCELYAVIRVHPEANSALLAPGAAARAAALLRGEPRLRALRGIQWDADIPTARLAEYSSFLRAFRPFLAPGQTLSVTALPDWLGARAYGDLCEAVDEVAPQFYGNHWPKPGAPPPALWETRDLWPSIRHSVRGRARVWVGLPAYGRCVVIDAAGRPVGVRHDLDPDQLLDDPAWEIEASDTRRSRWRSAEHGRAVGPGVPVEDTLALRCREPALAGPMEAPAGTRLWFQWPRAGGLRAAIRQLQATAPAGVEGVCFFRWPAPGEPLALPTASIAAAVASPSPTVGADSRLRVRLMRMESTVRVAVVNGGSDSPLLGRDLELVVVPPRGGEVLADGPVTWKHGGERVSRSRGDHAAFSRALLRPGRRWEACRVANARNPVRATVRWRDTDGRWREETAREPDTRADRRAGRPS